MPDKTILLVEDNLDDEELILQSLKDNRVLNRVIVARDGPEALDILFGSGPHADRAPVPLPTLVLLDLKLPKLSGLEVLQRLRADPRTALLQVVILTSSGEEEDVISSYRLGANSYVRKPVVFEEFSAAVRQLGLYWLLLNETPPGMA